ncbi:sentrin-specific protease 7 isoform X2 [Brachyhypopomus gauderio]|uniref:sentrin-specific protease 7 isoform X2 n=1 Tax=Brachyhypopomus gauderio TaxID=698409 RepID=UPI0040423161
MPHDKARVHHSTHSAGVVFDRRKVLAISPVGKLDSCRSGNPLKILKKRISSDADECADATPFVGMYPKIHWTQLASSEASSQSVQLNNGNQAVDNAQDDAVLLDINRRELKVILTDVLQTQVGQSYLSSCGPDSKMKQQSVCKGGARDRWCGRRLSAEQKDKKEGSPFCWEQTNLSDFHTTNTHNTKPLDSPSAEKNVTHPAKGTKSPRSTKLERIRDAPKQTESTASDEKESWSAGMASHHCENSELCPVEDSDSASPLHSEGTDVAESDQSAESALVEMPRCPSSRLALSEHSQRVRHSTREGRPPQHNISEAGTQESAEDEGGETKEEEQEKGESRLDSNGEMKEDWGGARRSVLRLSAGAVGSQPEMGLADGEAPPKRSRLQSSLDKSVLNSNCVRKASRPHTPEPIVLSSEEEEEKNENSGTLHLQTQEGAKVPHTPQRLARSIERKKKPNVLALASDMHTQITVDRITILLKDPSGSGLRALLPTAHVRNYSVWNGHEVRDTGLVKSDKTPPPSLLLLWLSEAQARRLTSDLSVMQLGKCKAESSTRALLCVCGALRGVEAAILASIMDMAGIRHGSNGLLSPLSPPESLELLQSEGDAHLLQLLQARGQSEAAAHEVSAHEVSAHEAAPTTPAAKDTEVQPDSVYTLRHSRARGRYSVSVSPRPEAMWSPYRHRGPAHRLIQFPPPPSKGAITVTTEDLECLDSGEFLNDVIIDFYLKYLLVQKAPHSSVRRSHVFSSFFYKQLTRRDNANEDSTSTPTQLRRHQRVRTWTRHVDIFDKDFLFVPVNQEAHWYLVVICFPGMDQPQYVRRTGQGSVQDTSEISSDSTTCSEPQEGNRPGADADRHPDESCSKSVSAPGPPNCTEKTCERQTLCKRPCILVMDSLKLSVHERIFKLLREYLQAEWEVKRGGYRDFSAERMVGSHCKVPLQDNSSDCGLYLLQYAESFLQDPVVNFDLPLNLESWFPRQQVREKREEIRDLVLYLYRFQRSLEEPPEKGNDVQ